MDKAEKVRSKIIILYILKIIPGLTLPELTSIVIDTCYMNYFSFVSAFDDLCSNLFITKSVRKNEESKDSNGNSLQRCDITPEGMKVLESLNHIIPEHIHSFLSSISRDWKDHKKKSSEVTSSYDPDLFGSYTVTLKLSDGLKEIIVLKLTVPDREMAKKVCKNWEEDTRIKYLGILESLTS